MYAIVDVETTGGKYNEEGITEIAIYKFDGHEIVDQFSSLINPEKPVQPFVVKLTGINNEMLKRAPKFYQVAKRVIEITEDCIIVAHNASFDYRMLRIEFERLGYEFKKDTLCTVQLSQKLLPKQKSHSLGKLTKALGIPITNRHRATGDALATVKLFQLLMQKDNDKSIIKASLTSDNRKKIDSGLKVLVDSVPSDTGVYYLYNRNNDLIYIGKSRNIKKRLNQHFLSQNKKSKEMTEHTDQVSFEKTGSELIALLKENIEIKKHQPVFNKALKKRIFSHGLYTFKNKDGYLCLKARLIKEDDNYITSFTSLKSARSFLEHIQEEYDLCPILLHLEKPSAQCFKYGIKKCKGACCSQESTDDYNKRVQKILDKHQFTSKNMIIIDRGRTATERSLVVVEDGYLKGYGFADLQIQITNQQMLEQIVSPLHNDRDSRHILQSYLRQKKVRKIIEF